MKNDVIKLLEVMLKLSRGKLIEDATKIQKQAEEKDYCETKEEKERYVNRELGHRGQTSSYLSIKEALAKLRGEKIDHEKLFKPYQNNENLWKNGELLI